MKRYQAVIETSKQNSTLRYTSKPYNTKKEALTDLNQELKRLSKKDQTVTLAILQISQTPELQEKLKKKYFISKENRAMIDLCQLLGQSDNQELRLKYFFHCRCLKSGYPHLYESQWPATPRS